jgi:hypothetical protein
VVVILYRSAEGIADIVADHRHQELEESEPCADYDPGTDRGPAYGQTFADGHGESVHGQSDGQQEHCDRFH